jgi:UDPglucose 6-dehydrogenase
MKITVIGSGYVGLVTSLGFANKNLKVTNVDLNKKKVQDIINKKPKIYEPGLNKILSKEINKNYFITSDYSNCTQSDCIFVAVNTPHKKSGIDLSYLISSCKKILSLIKEKKIKKKIVIVIKSTVVPGTLEFKIKPIFKNFKNIFVVNNPEFLREGSAIKDFLEPDRIVIGSKNKYVIKTLRKVYSKFDAKKIFVSATEAELCKYYSNIMLSNFIAFSNEFSDICKKFQNVNYSNILESFMYDRRFGVRFGKKILFPEIYKYLIPGPGYGGSCFPKDTKSFSKFAKSKGLNQRILNSIIYQNDNRLKEKIKSIKKNFNKFCIIGVGFKEGTIDLRESKSLELIKILKSKKNKIYYIDKKIDLKDESLKKINFVDLKKIKLEIIIIMNHSRETLKYNWKNYTKKNKTIVYDFRAKLLPERNIKIVGVNF